MEVRKILAEIGVKDIIMHSPGGDLQEDQSIPCLLIQSGQCPIL